MTEEFEIPVDELDGEIVMGRCPLSRMLGVIALDLEDERLIGYALGMAYVPIAEVIQELAELDTEGSRKLIGFLDEARRAYVSGTGRN